MKLSAFALSCDGGTSLGLIDELKSEAEGILSSPCSEAEGRTVPTPDDLTL